MKKGIYLYTGSDVEFVGVDRKIDNQLKALSKKFEIKKILVRKSRVNMMASITWRLPFGSWGAEYDEAIREIQSYIGNDEPAFFYIRTPYSDRKYLAFISNLRERFRETKILLEIPTYPYIHEVLRSKTMWPWFFKDKIYSRFLHKYVDRIVTFSNDDRIFGIPTIKTMNGMSIEDINLAKVEEDENVLRVIAVAMMQEFHGFERFIRGLASYYKTEWKKKIYLVMVGYGKELGYYESLTKQLGLSEYVLFKGKLKGEALDRAYDGCDLAIDSLGRYKIGMDVFSSIKLGEYLGKGIPVITGARTKLFDKYGDKYNLRFSNDATDIDIYRVLDYYDTIYRGRDKTEVRKEIHEFALKTIDINVVMKDIISYLDE